MAKYLSKLNGYEIKDAVARAKDQEQDTQINELGGKVAILETMVGGDTELPSTTSEVEQGSGALVTSGGVYNAIENVKTPINANLDELNNTTAEHTQQISNLETTVDSNSTAINSLSSQVNNHTTQINNLSTGINTGDTNTLNSAKAYTNTKFNELSDEVEATKKSVSDGKTLVATAITSKGVATSSDATFVTMATNINAIKTGKGNATVDQVLSGATFTNSTGEELTGTMSDNGAVSKTFTPGASSQSYTIPVGYHNGSGKVTCNAVTLKKEQQTYDGNNTKTTTFATTSIKGCVVVVFNDRNQGTFDVQAKINNSWTTQEKITKSTYDATMYEVVINKACTGVRIVYTHTNSSSGAGTHRMELVYF